MRSSRGAVGSWVGLADAAAEVTATAPVGVVVGNTADFLMPSHVDVLPAPGVSSYARHVGRVGALPALAFADSSGSVGSSSSPSAGPSTSSVHSSGRASSARSRAGQVPAGGSARRGSAGTRGNSASLRSPAGPDFPSTVAGTVKPAAAMDVSGVKALPQIASAPRFRTARLGGACVAGWRVAVVLQQPFWVVEGVDAAAQHR